MPVPKKNEGKQDFLKRCTADLVDNGGDKNRVAFAKCNSVWDQEKGEASLTLSAPVEMTLDASLARCTLLLSR